MNYNFMKKIFLCLTAGLIFFSCNVAQAPSAISDSPDKEVAGEELQLEGELFSDESGSRAKVDILQFIDVEDIINNPADYFSCIINYESSASDPFSVSVGVNIGKLQQMVSKVPTIKFKDSKYNKWHAKNFRLLNVTSNKLVIGCTFRIRKYVDPFRTKVFDAEGIGVVEISYGYDPQRQTIGFNSYKVKQVYIKNCPWLSAILNTFKSKLQKDASKSNNVYIGFLPNYGVNFDRFYVSNQYLYAKFRFSKGMLGSVKSGIRAKGIKLIDNSGIAIDNPDQIRD